ncbi:MAG: phosphatidylinositol-specific phospholipase C [Bacteroidaceae bacterium]|nr:phosphatidylinositol-specific phospholipase C [Bacteroidaceae bacterium]
MKKYILFTFFCLCIVPPVLAIDYQNWMRPLDDNLFLSRLSIPGAHDAATSSCSSSGMTGSAHTQTYTIAQQLERGVRFFDLRPAWNGSDMVIYHGIVSTGVKFNDALNTLCNFLNSHPKEFLFVVMRHEDDTEGSSEKAQWPTQMKNCLNAKRQYIIDYSPTLTVRDMRGKLLVMSRNTYDDGPIGGYLNGGGDNGTLNKTLVGPSGAYMNMTIQDMYDVAGSGQLNQKVTAMKDLLDRSMGEKEYRLYMNHTSGYSKKATIPFIGTSYSTFEGVQECARTCNKEMINYMKGKTGPMGFILMDFAGDNNYQGQELIDLIINNNFSTYANERDADNHVVKGNKVYILPLGRDRVWEGLCYFREAPQKNSSSVDALTSPNALWKAITYSPNSSWVNLEMPMGSPSYLAPYRTTWEGEYNTYWIRREFTLDEVNEATTYYLEAYHDDHYDIYVNGRQIHKADDWTEANGAPITKKVTNATLKVGQNVIAIHIQQNTGGAYFDCGLYGIFDPDKQVSISEIPEDKTTFPADGKAVVYDLSGKKTNSPQKGLYVIDGKKTVVQ